MIFVMCCWTTLLISFHNPQKSLRMVPIMRVSVKSFHCSASSGSVYNWRKTIDVRAHRLFILTKNLVLSHNTCSNEAYAPTLTLAQCKPSVKILFVPNSCLHAGVGSTTLTAANWPPTNPTVGGQFAAVCWLSLPVSGEVARRARVVDSYE